MRLPLRFRWYRGLLLLLLLLLLKLIPLTIREKRDKKARNGVVEEGEIQEETPQSKLRVQRPLKCIR